MALQLRIRPTDERRLSSRRTIGQVSTLRAGQARPIDVTVTDLSSEGCQISCDADLALGTPLSIGLAGSGMAHGHVVRRTGQHYGCAFDTILTPEQLGNAFGATAVVDLMPVAPWAVPMPNARADRWPGAVRLAVLVGAAGASWAAMAGLAVAVLG